MGFLSNIENFFSGSRANNVPSTPEPRTIHVGADNRKEPLTTFDNKNITFTGDLTTYDYDSILRNKQNNINQLYELADYYVDKDPVFRGIIKGVYTPFSITDKWRLIGTSEDTKKKYEEYYERINLTKLMRSIFYQYYKYANVYLYLMPDGNLITLPQHRVRIGSVTVDNEPVVEFDAQSIANDMGAVGQEALQNFLKDKELQVRLRGFPPEVGKALSGSGGASAQWVQLDPANTFVMQDIKEDWTRYAVPMIASALTPLSKKALIENYESALLNLGMRGFLHVTYGDKEPNSDFFPDVAMLTQVQALFRSAMTGTGLAVTNPFAKAEFIQSDADKLFQFDKYKDVNAEILSAGGISGIIVSGRAEDGSNFASSQVSMQTAALRIKQAKDSFCEVMNKVNARLNGTGSTTGITHSKPENVPKFTFPPIDLANNGKFRETTYKLWQAGVLSNETTLEIHGYDMGQEIERIRSEEAQGFIRPNPYKEQETSLVEKVDQNKLGRPVIDDDDRTSDKNKAKSGAQPKPSSPEGSESNE